MTIPITESQALHALCTQLAAADAIAVDSEFMRESTYYPKLCLLQLATADGAWAVDPLAPGLDLQPLLEVMADENVLKVFHSAGQDLEIFYHLMGRVPAPLFDTQVAAMALGYGEQVSYQSLIQQTLGVHIDKGARFTDWARRPLSERQIEYAMGDVTYLMQAFPMLLDDLKKRGRGEWLDEEMSRLLDPATFSTKPDEAWKRLKAPSRNAQVMGRLKALAAWREIEAQKRDLPRPRMLKDETLVDIVLHPPKVQADLGKVRGLSERWETNDMGASLMAAIAAATPMAADEIPARDRSMALNRTQSLIADLLKLLLKIRCEEAAVAPKLVARSDDLEALVGGAREGLALLNGWRFEVFGRDALALVEGRIGFGVEKNRVKLMEMDATP
jgi:ribonuclease D